MLNSNGRFVRSPLGFTGIELLTCVVRDLADEPEGCDFFDFAQTQLRKTYSFGTQKYSKTE